MQTNRRAEKKTATGISSGKVIVSGEHSAVYGEPAIASSISLGVTITIDHQLVQAPTDQIFEDFTRHIFSLFAQTYKVATQGLTAHLTAATLPIGQGLGGSAAIAHATVKALITYFQLEECQDDVLTLVAEAEKFAHGNPSGLDATAVVREELLVFQRTESGFIYRPLITSALKHTVFFLINSGKPVESTKEMVAQVRAQDEQIRQPLVKRIGAVTQRLINELTDNHFVPERLQENERLLEELGVVGQTAQTMISQVEEVGGVMKVTGAGGVQQGSGMMIAYHPQPETMQKLIHHHGWESYQITFS